VNAVPHRLLRFCQPILFKVQNPISTMTGKFTKSKKMSGRGGRGGRKGPDLSWEDPQDLPSGQGTPIEKKKLPPPNFPPISFKVPRPIDANELASVKSYLRFRERVHNGPYYSVLQSSNLTDDKGKVHKRAGFDPFNDQEKYTAKYERKKRTVPDLTTRDYGKFASRQQGTRK